MILFRQDHGESPKIAQDSNSRSAGRTSFEAIARIRLFCLPLPLIPLFRNRRLRKIASVCCESFSALKNVWRVLYAACRPCRLAFRLSIVPPNVAGLKIRSRDEMSCASHHTALARHPGKPDIQSRGDTYSIHSRCAPLCVKNRDVRSVHHRRSFTGHLPKSKKSTGHPCAQLSATKRNLALNRFFRKLPSAVLPHHSASGPRTPIALRPVPRTLTVPRSASLRPTTTCFLKRIFCTARRESSSQAAFRSVRPDAPAAQILQSSSEYVFSIFRTFRLPGISATFTRPPAISGNDTR